MEYWRKHTGGSIHWERMLCKKLKVGDIMLLRDSDQVPANVGGQEVASGRKKDPPTSRNDLLVGVRGGPAEFKREYQQTFQQTFKNSNRYLKIAHKTCCTHYFLHTNYYLLSAAQRGSVRVEPGSDRFRPIVHPLNLDPDLRFGSGNSLNLGPNLGPVQAGSGSNRGSESNHGITIIRATMRPYEKNVGLLMSLECNEKEKKMEHTCDCSHVSYS